MKNQSRLAQLENFFKEGKLSFSGLIDTSKLCKDCLWFREKMKHPLNKKLEVSSACVHPECSIHIDPVYGKETKIAYVHASLARDVKRGCGPFARLFEKKNHPNT